MGPDSHQTRWTPRARPTTTLHKISTLALSPFLRNIHFIFFYATKSVPLKRQRKNWCQYFVPYFCRGHATYKPPYRSVGPSVCRSVRRSVTLCFFCIFGHFKGWKICNWASPCPNHYCPCPNHYCPCPNHHCPCPNHYCPCPTVHDRSSRVYGLVFSSACRNVIRVLWPNLRLIFPLEGVIWATTPPHGYSVSLGKGPSRAGGIFDPRSRLNR